MCLDDDKDIARAVGYVAIYSVYLEDSLYELILCTKNYITLPRNIQAFRLIDSAQHLIKALKKEFEIDSNYSEEYKVRILNTLKSVIKIANERNDVLHSSIISELSGKKIQKNKKTNSSKEIISKDIYNLANDIFQLHAAVHGLRVAVNSFFKA